MCLATTTRFLPKGATGQMIGETKKPNAINRALDRQNKSQESSLSERLSKKVRGQIGFGNVRGKLRTRGMSGTMNDLKIPL